MRSTRIPMTEMVAQRLCQNLNHVLSNAMTLRMQAQHAHWNVRGRHFASRHELFEVLFKNLDSAIDDMAERITALGGIAEGRIEEVARMRGLPSYDPAAPTQHIESLADAYGAFVASLREELEYVDRTGEPVTEDLMTQILRQAEHDLYILEAHLEPRDPVMESSRALPVMPDAANASKKRTRVPAVAQAK